MEINSKANEFLWVERYRPTKISETILPENIKTIFQKFVDDKSIPNLLLSGTPGTGKTTIAIAMLKELDCDYIKINGSLDNGIDVLRYEIQNFASSISLSGGRKYIIIDEADNLTPAIQKGLRSAIEDYSKNCGFIFTCNYKHKLIEPLRSRFSEINFKINKADKPKIAAQFFKRSIQILENEHIAYDQKVLAKLIEKYFPDFRSILGKLQTYAASGKIDEGIFTSLKEESLDLLFTFLKEKKFVEMRKWVADNSDQDPNILFRQIYDIALEKIEMKSIPGFVVTLADYMYKHAFVADAEINFTAFLTEIMIECSFK